MLDELLTTGAVKVPAAIDPDLARSIAVRCWSELGVDPGDRETWTAPVMHRGLGGPDLVEAAASPRLTQAIGQVLDGWRPRHDLGLFVARFPTGVDSKDTGWHVDASFHPEGRPWPEETLRWSVNARSRGRALLLLVLWTEVGEDDAPTRIRLGSHHDAEQALEPCGEAGVDIFTAGPLLDAASAHRPEALATGSPGDVWICHPLLVHAAQLHRGTSARLISQPAIEPLGEHPTWRS